MKSHRYADIMTTV